MRKTTAIALATASLLAMAGTAHAQTATDQNAAATPQSADGNNEAGEPDQSALGDIVVTAQRRVERVTDVPISITVVDQAQLERQQINTFSDLNRIAPSLEIQQAPGQNTGGGGSIRGIGTQTFSAGAVASVGVVVDGVSQGNANISDLFDISRVEVLKGPQGTLFGLTTSAGVINITTNAPDPSGFAARLRTELSNAGTAGSIFGDQVVQGMVNVPLGTDAALRVSGVGNFRQGPDRNALTGEKNNVDRYGGRARLRWDPTDDLRFDLIGDYTSSRFDGGGDFFTFVRAGGPGILPLPTPFPIADTGVANQLASCGVTPREGNRDYCTTDDVRGRSRNYGVSLEVDYKAEPFTLTSITAYRGSNDRGRAPSGNIFRADPLEIHITGGDLHNDLDLLTQEFRISSSANQFFEYTVGTFLSHQRAVQQPQTFDIALEPAPGVIIPVESDLGARNTIVDDSLAVYGQGTFHITPAFRLIAGGRYTSERLALDRNSLDTPLEPYSHRQLSTGIISYRFGAQYDLAANAMAYATVSHGYKGGQIAIPSLPDLPYVVRPEVPQDYELGLKATLFRSWVADLNLFYDKIKDFQAQQCTVNATTSALSCVQTNIDGVKSRGAEINFFGQVTTGLSLNTGFIWAKATYPHGYLGTDGTDIGGQQLAYAPEYKFTLSGEYEHNVTAGLKGFVGADAVWKSRIRYEANSRSETTFRPHWMVGGRVGVRSENDRYEIALFARNLFNVHEPELYQSDFPYNGTADIGAIYGPMSFRQIGLSLDAKF